MPNDVADFPFALDGAAYQICRDLRKITDENAAEREAREIIFVRLRAGI